MHELGSYRTVGLTGQLVSFQFLEKYIGTNELFLEDNRLISNSPRLVRSRLHQTNLSTVTGLTGSWMGKMWISFNLKEDMTLLKSNLHK